MSNPVERLLEALRGHGCEPRKAGDGWTCRCPAHDDRSPSLSIHAGDDGRALVNCHAGCSGDAVCAAIGLRLADLFPDDPNRRNGRTPRTRRVSTSTETRPAAPAANSVDVDAPKPVETFATAREVVEKLERRRGAKAAHWVYTDALGEPVGLVVRWNLPPDPDDAERKPRKDIQPVSKLPEGWANKGMPTPRPLYRLPDLLATKPGDRVYVVEGEKAADACRAVGLVATTSPHGSNSPAQADWSPLAGRDVVILPDHDDAGETYAAAVARLALAAGAKSVRVVRLVELWAGMPKGGDMADLLNNRGGDVDPIRVEVEALAEKAEPEAVETIDDAPADEGTLPQAEQLVRLALDLFRLGQTPKRDPFAVMNTGPNVAGMLRGSGGSVRDILAREYRRRHGRIMNQTAYADALATLRGEALETPCEGAFVRVGTFGDGVVLDLGTASGEAVVVDRAGWRIVDRSPILFQRSALTDELPAPLRGGSLESLRALLNVTNETWPILLGWMVAALIPDMPHPILMLGGQQGTGKTTAARYACGVIDPSSVPVQSQPNNHEAWAMSVANCWATVIDNVSSVAPWWSDALCKVVTGDGWVRRTLYTDGDVSVLSFRRVIALTSIDAGALRGDLGERLVLVDLEPIEPSKRKTERELDAAYNAAKPAILGALLDLLVSVLCKVDSIRLPALPRMADFARVLAAVDATLGTDSLALYADQGKRIAGEVLDADPVGDAIARFARDCGEWSGTAGALLKAIKPDDAGREWPKNPRGLAGALKRLIPALALQDVLVTAPRPSDRTRTYSLSATARTAQPPKGGCSVEGTGGVGPAVEFHTIGDRPSNRPSCNRQPDAANAVSAPLGDSGDPAHQSASAGDGWGEV